MIWTNGGTYLTHQTWGRHRLVRSFEGKRRNGETDEEREFPVDLLTNAIKSIQVGIEDFKVGTRSRLPSSARNLPADILLLYKEALRRPCPPNSNEALRGAPKKRQHP